MTPEFLTLPNKRLAYQRLDGRKDKPCILFLGGYASDMTGTKASFLSDYCSKANLAFVRFNYSGHGQSDGDFKQGTIGEWFNDALSIFDKLVEDKCIVIGSSMGGWLAFMLAMKKAAHIKAFIGIAAAPDFTEDLMWDKFTTEQKSQLKQNGFIYDENAPPHERAPITLKLIEEARQHLILKNPIHLNCPVRLLQGMKDTEVSWEYALRISEKVTTEDMRITLVKDGDHRLSREHDLDLLRQAVEEFTL